MRANVLVVGLLSGLVLVGCSKKTPPAPVLPPPLTPEVLSSFQADYQKIDPKVRVGAVVAVDSANSYLAIERVAFDGLHQGDVVSIVTTINGVQTPIAQGTIVNLELETKRIVIKYVAEPIAQLPTMVDAKSEPIAGAKRGPQKDDLAVFFLKK